MSAAGRDSAPFVVAIAVVGQKFLPSCTSPLSLAFCLAAPCSTSFFSCPLTSLAPTWLSVRQSPLPCSCIFICGIPLPVLVSVLFRSFPSSSSFLYHRRSTLAGLRFTATCLSQATSRLWCGLLRAACLLGQPRGALNVQCNLVW